MWLPDRRGVILLAAAAVAACGFQPVDGPGGGARGLSGQVSVNAPEDRDGFNLVRRLEKRLGRPRTARYALGYRLSISEEEQGITPAQEITRYNVLGRVDYTLTDLGTDALAGSGTVSSFTSYAATGTTLGTLTAQRDARERLAVILADRIIARLLATGGGRDGDGGT